MGGRISNAIERLKPVIVMVLIQSMLAGMNIFYKLAGVNGMNISILIAYRFIFAAASITPVAAIVERKSRPKLTWLVLFQSFLAGLLVGSLPQNLYIQGLILTSSSFGAAILNLLPALTFILAILLRMERVGLSTMVGKAKVIGTLTCIGGAMFLSFYKGKEINIWPIIVNLVEVVSKQPAAGGHVATTHHNGTNPTGIVLLLVACFVWATGLIFQSKLLKNYPCPYSGTALMMNMAAIQALVYALCREQDWNQWKLGWNFRLLAASYCGIIGTSVAYTMIGWCMQKRGPVYVSIFNPLLLIIVTIAGSLILDEKLHVGSVLGSLVIIIGLYMVVWGKSKEMKNLIVSQGLTHSNGSSIRMELDQNNHSSHHSIASNILLGPGLPLEGFIFSSARHEINLANGSMSSRSRVVPVVLHVEEEEYTMSKRMSGGAEIMESV